MFFSNCLGTIPWETWNPPALPAVNGLNPAPAYSAMLLII